MINMQQNGKKEWQKPELTSHGSVQKLTKGSLTVIGSVAPDMMNGPTPL